MSIDIKNIGTAFYFPIVMGVFAAIYCYIKNYGFENAEVMKNIKSSIGIFFLPWVFIWVLGLFQDLLDSKGKELLLSLPYDDTSYGIKRVLRITLCFLLIFYALFFGLSWSLKTASDITVMDLILPVCAIMFYSSLAFLSIVLTKSMMMSYCLIATFSIFAYLTRGGAFGALYPFQWSFPKPFLGDGFAAFVLTVVTIVLFSIAVHLFKKRSRLL